jgi:Zn-dependent protease
MTTPERVSQPASDEPRLPPLEPPPEKGPGKGLWVAIGAAALLALKKAPVLLVPLKFLKLGKFWFTALSMGAMIWFEAQRYGLAYGVGFVLLILLHELGHGYAIKRAGLDSGWPVFIPFFGALISMKERPRSPLVEAEIAIAGPIAGAAAAAACAAYGMATGSRLMLALAYAGFFLNLLNMIPISPLDGGRVARVFSRRAWVLGAVAIVALYLLTQAPQLMLIGFLGIMRAWRGTDEGVEVSDEDRRSTAARYFGLLAFLGIAAWLTHRLLDVRGA